MSQLSRVINLCRRTASNSTFAQHRYRQQRSTYQQKHRDQLPELNTYELRLLSQLNREGIVVTSLKELGLSLTPSMWNSAHQVAENLKRQPRPSPGSFLTTAQPSEMLRHPDLFAWGMQPRLLDLLEHYLCLPVAYHGVYLRRDSANSVLKKSRLWHTDMEDDSTLKIMVYLHEMDAKGGPFEYLPKQMSDEVQESLGHRCGYIRPGVLEQVVQQKQWKTCLGAAGTVAIIDTGRLIHRGKRPEHCDRYSLFFDYTSQVPRRPYYCKSSLPLTDLAHWSKHWNERQQQAVFWREQ